MMKWPENQSIDMINAADSLRDETRKLRELSDLRLQTYAEWEAHRARENNPVRLIANSIQDGIAYSLNFLGIGEETNFSPVTRSGRELERLEDRRKDQYERVVLAENVYWS